MHLLVLTHPRLVVRSRKILSKSFHLYAPHARHINTHERWCRACNAPPTHRRQLCSLSFPTSTDWPAVSCSFRANHTHAAARSAAKHLHHTPCTPAMRAITYRHANVVSGKWLCATSDWLTESAVRGYRVASLQQWASWCFHQ